MKNVTVTNTQEINRLHSEIIEAARTSLEKAIRIGELLSDIKSGLQHGGWLTWLKENVAFHDRTARRYIKVYEQRDKLDSVSDLTGAYRLLAASSVDSQGRTAPELREVAPLSDVETVDDGQPTEKQVPDVADNKPAVEPTDGDAMTPAERLEYKKRLKQQAKTNLALSRDAISSIKQIIAGTEGSWDAFGNITTALVQQQQLKRYKS